MIKQQIVLWNLKGESQEDSASAVVGLRAAFERMVAKVPGLLNMEIGINVSGIDYACDVVLNSKIDLHESLTAYAQHENISG